MVTGLPGVRSSSHNSSRPLAADIGTGTCNPIADWVKASLVGFFNGSFGPESSQPDAIPYRAVGVAGGVGNPPAPLSGRSTGFANLRTIHGPSSAPAPLLTRAFEYD